MLVRVGLGVGVKVEVAVAEGVGVGLGGSLIKMRMNSYQGIGIHQILLRRTTGGPVGSVFISVSAPSSVEWTSPIGGSWVIPLLLRWMGE